MVPEESVSPELPPFSRTKMPGTGCPCTRSETDTVSVWAVAGSHIPRSNKISKAGNERLRQLLFVGAMSVIRFAKPGSKSASAWLLQLLERKPRKLAAVALANKMARIVWAMMATGEAYRGSKRAAAAA